MDFISHVLEIAQEAFSPLTALLSGEVLSTLGVLLGFTFAVLLIVAVASLAARKSRHAVEHSSRPVLVVAGWSALQFVAIVAVVGAVTIFFSAGQVLGQQ